MNGRVYRHECVVLEKVPATPEGRLFLKQLRKYLRPQYTIGARGRHSNRQGLARLLALQGLYGDRGEMPSSERVHDKLRAGMSCKHAETMTVTIWAPERERDIQWRGLVKKPGFYVRVEKEKQPDDTFKAYRWQGPYRTYDAAMTVLRVARGLPTKG